MIDKEATIYDIAKVLEISPATVSRGLKDDQAIKMETKIKIWDTASTLGYRRNKFAGSLCGARTNTIGVIIPRLNSYLMLSVIAGIEKIARERGFLLIIGQSHECMKREASKIQSMFNSRIDGLLVSIASDTKSLDYFKDIINKNIPVIFFDQVFNRARYSNIVIDNAKAGYDATTHLISQGCKRIIIIVGSLNRNIYSDRFEGYQKALLESGLKYDPSYCIINNLSEQAGEDVALQILSMNPMPDGIFASNDTTAVACIAKLIRAGIKVPEQIAVVGFNNDPISRVIQPNLTTIEYPGFEMGELAANNLIDSILNGTSRNINTVMLRHNLVLRQSSQKLNNDLIET